MRLLPLLVPILGFAGHTLAAENPKNRPNIIFVLTDDFGRGDIGIYGGTLVPTPNLDRMAREGTRLTQFYVASPICSPSRTGCTTGQFPARARITSYLQTRAGNRACGQADFLDPKHPSLARLLKTAGYATAHIGKWHMGGGRDVANPPPISDYGFDEAVSTWESPCPHPDIDPAGPNPPKVKRWERTAFFVDKTLDFLRRHPDQPCYVNLWPDDTHTPYVPSPAMKEKHGGNRDGNGIPNYKGVLEEYDKQIGRLLDGLRDAGLAEKTLVILTGDNGPLPTYQGKRTVGLRGSKLSLYEGGIREPLLVWWPGHTPADKVNDQTVFATVDLLPSLCQLAGAKIPADVAACLDGEDLSPVFDGATPQRQRPLFWEYGRNNQSFAYPQGRDRSPNVALRDGNWKLLVNADGTNAQLFDLLADPDENHDLAAEQPERTKEMADRAVAWRKSMP